MFRHGYWAYFLIVLGLFGWFWSKGKQDKRWKAFAIIFFLIFGVAGGIAIYFESTV